MRQHEQTPLYEAVPSSDLPLLNLSRSVGGEISAFIHSIFCCRAVRTEPQHIYPIQRHLQDANAPVEQMGCYWLARRAFELGCILGGVACYLQPDHAQIVAACGFGLTIPFNLISLAFLRLDMLKLLLTTYDFWFYALYNTFGAILIAKSLGDARACIAMILWVANSHVIVIDANTRFISYVNIASVFIIVLNMLALFAIETDTIHGWQALEIPLRHKHDDVMMANDLIANVLLTTTIIITRNAYRRHNELAEQAKICCSMLRCLNYRCRIKAIPVNAARIAQLEAMTPLQRAYYATGMPQLFPLTQMEYLRPQFLLDPANTYFPVDWHPDKWYKWFRRSYPMLGCAGLGLTAAVIGLYPSPLVGPCAVAGLVCTMVFIGVSLGLFHRPAFRVLLLSFDYIFPSMQLSLGFICTAMLFYWDARCFALVSMWIWLHWVMAIDALTLHMKNLIAFDVKCLVVPTLLLFLAAQVAAVIEVVWSNQWALSDRVIVSLTGRIHIRLLPCFVSRLIITFFWSLRLLWRVVTSGESDTIVKLGRVAYRYTTTIVSPRPSIRDAIRRIRSRRLSSNRSASMTGRNASIVASEPSVFKR